MDSATEAASPKNKMNENNSDSCPICYEEYGKLEGSWFDGSDCL